MIIIRKLQLSKEMEHDKYWMFRNPEEEFYSEDTKHLLFLKSDPRSVKFIDSFLERKIIRKNAVIEKDLLKVFYEDLFGPDLQKYNPGRYELQENLYCIFTDGNVSFVSTSDENCLYFYNIVSHRRPATIIFGICYKNDKIRFTGYFMCKKMDICEKILESTTFYYAKCGKCGEKEYFDLFEKKGTAENIRGTEVFDELRKVLSISEDLDGDASYDKQIFYITNHMKKFSREIPEEWIPQELL